MPFFFCIALPGTLELTLISENVTHKRSLTRNPRCCCCCCYTHMWLAKTCFSSLKQHPAVFLHGGKVRLEHHFNDLLTCTGVKATSASDTTHPACPVQDSLALVACPAPFLMRTYQVQPVCSATLSSSSSHINIHNGRINV